MASNNSQYAASYENNTAFLLEENKIIEESLQQVQNGYVTHFYTEEEVTAADALILMSRQQPTEQTSDEKVESTIVPVIKKKNRNKIHRRNWRNAILCHCLEILRELQK